MVAAGTGNPMDIEQATFQLERALLFHKLLAIGAPPPARNLKSGGRRPT
jgi:hypothetical protein